MKKVIVSCLLVLFGLLKANTANVLPGNSATDTVQVSLLTCSPGAEIYNLFGHTAIRYQNKKQLVDVVFNYGMFNFRKPHFVFRFTLGQTDYELGVEDYQSFLDNYAKQGRSIEEQVLNLTPTEKQRLTDLLMQNYLPENRVYRYNFFYDNCSTRPRDKIEQSIDGKVVYPPYQAERSFRDIIHQYTVGHPWARFGIDLCLGAAADKPITQRLMMFCPFYLRDFAKNARIVSREGNRPLVSGFNKLLISQSTDKGHDYCPTPLQCMLLLFIIITGLTIFGLKKKKSMWLVDLILFTAAGLGGCIIAFLMLFSTHPTVSSNFQILVLHPFYLFCLPWILIAERIHRRSFPMIVFSVILTLFIALFALMPQKIDFAIVPLAASLLVRSLSHVILTYKNKR